MPIETKEKFAPNSFIANVKNEAKLILEYDLTNLGYYRISPLKEKAFLYSGEKPAGKKSYNLKKEVELAKDDLVAIKSFDNNNNIAYVIVLSGEENLKHGWVKLADIRNANSSTIPTNFPPSKVGTDKVDLISKLSGADAAFPPTLYLDSKGNKPNKGISYKQQLGAFPPNTPLKRLSKKNKNYIKVRILAGPFLGAEGYVFKEDVAEPPDPNTFNKNRYKTVELTLDGALTRLNDEFASKKIEELTGLAHLSLKAPTALNIIQRKILDKLSPKDFIQSNVCYYNQTDKTLDILLPFFFGPSTSSPSVFEANLAKIKDKGEEKGLLYVETYAKAKSLFSDYKPDSNDDKIPESFLPHVYNDPSVLIAAICLSPTDNDAI